MYKYKAEFFEADNNNMLFPDQINLIDSNMFNAITQLDKTLYTQGFTNSTNDYSILFNSNEEEVEVEFGDSEQGQSIFYTIVRM